MSTRQRSMKNEWVTEPLADFSRAAVRKQFERAQEEIAHALGQKVPLLIGVESVESGQWLESINPAHPTERIGDVAQADERDVQHAIEVAREAQRRWGQVAPAERVASLRRTAALLRKRRFWFAALAVREVGKTWREADAEVVEAIDFLEYYSARMLELAAGKPLPQVPGESNRYVYIPRGVSAVIAPWNFPLAIPMGMVAAALVTGNVVILKPAEQSPVIAYHLTCLLHEAGVPREVVQYVPGLGEEVGDALVQDPHVAVILFTGSKAVGLSIVEKASRIVDGQPFVKHIVTEMGGKNALIVDDDADLDAAIQGIMISAFSYGGQKCSAASRVIVHEAIAEPLMKRLRSALEGLVIRDPQDPRCQMGPLIDEMAVRRVREAVTRGSQGATVLYQCPAERLPAEGFFVGPTVLADVDPAAPVAREELFGPVACLFQVRTFEEALALANESEYGLTGGVYSRCPSHIEQASRTLAVGNLYINRPITGAVVGRQPFGGYKLSGLGTKAGGPDYLLQLVLPKTICENTSRHGMPLE